MSNLPVNFQSSHTKCCFHLHPPFLAQNPGWKKAKHRSNLYLCFFSFFLRRTPSPVEACTHTHTYKHTHAFSYTALCRRSDRPCWCVQNAYGNRPIKNAKQLAITEKT